MSRRVHSGVNSSIGKQDRKKFQASLERDRHLFDARYTTYVEFRNAIGDSRVDFGKAAAQGNVTLASAARSRVWEAFAPIQLIGGNELMVAAGNILDYATGLISKPRNFSEEEYSALVREYLMLARRELLGLTDLPKLRPSLELTSEDTSAPHNTAS